MPYRVMDTEGLLALMKKLQGEQPNKDFAKRLGISPQYLSDIYHRRREPGASSLRALGASRTVSYAVSTDLKEEPHDNNKPRSKPRK